MAKVAVRMYATVRDAAGSDGCLIEADDILELELKLLERFGEELGTVIGSRRGAFDRAVFLVNGNVVGPGDVRRVSLQDDDEVSIFPPISGG